MLDADTKSQTQTILKYTFHLHNTNFFNVGGSKLLSCFKRLLMLYRLIILAYIFNIYKAVKYRACVIVQCQSFLRFPYPDPFRNTFFNGLTALLGYLRALLEYTDFAVFSLRCFDSEELSILPATYVFASIL